jgi:hypothetical protein
VGMVAYDLAHAGTLTQSGFFDPFERRRRLEVAIDGLAERFGSKAVQRGDDLATPRGISLTSNLDFLDDGVLNGED